MTNPMILIHNVETGEIIEREMTADELAQNQRDRAEAKAQDEEQAAKATAKQAVLDRLGLTAEEAALLLG